MERTADPDALGFDPDRLARIDAHFARYVDDGRLAGWQVAVTRRGEVVHTSTYGLRDREAGRAGRAGHALAHLLDDQADHLGRARCMLWEQGRFELTDPVSRYIPSFADVRVYDKGSAQQAVHRAGHRAGAGLAPAHPHRRADLRLPAHAPWSTRSTAPAGYEWGAPPGTRPGRAPCDAWAALPLLFQPGTGWGYGGRHRRARPAGRGAVRPAARRVPGRARHRARSAWPTPASGSSPSGADRLAALYTPNPADGTGRAARRARRRRAAPSRRSCPAAAGWSRPPPTTPLHPDAAARRRARRRPAARHRARSR